MKLLTPLILSLGLILQGCFSSPTTSGRRSVGGTSNTADSVDVGYGRILQDNPIILSGNSNLAATVDLNSLLQSQQDFIVDDQFLIGDCTGVTDCYQVKEEQTSSFLQSTSKKWAYDANSGNFLQVHTFGHVKNITTLFHNHLTTAYTQANPAFAPSAVFPFQYATSLPFSLFTSDAHWNGGGTTLSAFSLCDVENNAFFSPATFSLCFGTDPSNPTVHFAQDSTVIYHEMGHAFNLIKLNLRNVAGGLTTRSGLGQLFYDEAGAIGEGISDYYSYVMNQRTHIGEWALGRFNGQSRPMSEDDSLHVAGLDTSADSRLSYPTYVNYDPNEPETPFEDIHYAGQIISHYLVAVTKDYMTECSLSEDDAIYNVLYLLSETFAEMGDLTARATDHTGVDTVNLTSNHADEWIRMVTPINFRRFAQTFAKFQKIIFNDANLARCNGGVYPIDNIESLLDQYGLLLFDTYNEDGNNSVAGHAGTHTSITLTNRVNTVMLSKDKLKLDPTSGSAQAFIFDNRTDLVNALASLQSSGQVTDFSSQLESDLPYNNGNAKISPGELVGLALNVYNDSNSTMAGVQILANDWDHFKDGEPCNTFEDAFPLDSEGAAQLTTGEGAVGGCDYITRSNGDDGDLTHPVCFVELNETSATIWDTQDQLRINMGLDASSCLGGSTSKDDCFVRALSGADQATYSKLDPNSTWASTLSTSGSPEFSLSNIIFFEVSKDIPPGTTFNCRLRARFTNCSDCYHDSGNANDDYLDYEYSGGDPFTIINFQFTVTD